MNLRIVVQTLGEYRLSLIFACIYIENMYQIRGVVIVSDERIQFQSLDEY